MIDRTLFRFLLVGVGNTVLGLGVIFGARHFCSDFAANLIGYLVVVPVSFMTHRDFSFKDTGRRMSAFIRYLPTIGAGYGANLLVLYISLQADMNPYLCQTFAIGAHVAITYILSRAFVFISPTANSR